MDFISNPYIIVLSFAAILIIHFLLALIRDRKYIQPFKTHKDPKSLSIKDLNEIPLVNINVPAWNEGELFRQAFSSIIKLKFPNIKDKLSINLKGTPV